MRAPANCAGKRKWTHGATHRGRSSWKEKSFPEVPATAVAPTVTFRHTTPRPAKNYGSFLQRKRRANLLVQTRGREHPLNEGRLRPGHCRVRTIRFANRSYGV